MLPFLVHLGYAIMLCGFVARDILALRALLLAGQLVLAIYAFGLWTGHWHSDLPERVYFELIPHANEFGHP